MGLSSITSKCHCNDVGLFRTRASANTPFVGCAARMWRLLLIMAECLLILYCGLATVDVAVI